MIGRPQSAEAAAYYFPFIDQVSGEDPVVILENQLDECLEFFAQISEEKSRYRYAREKWSIRQVLNHITDTERVMSFRALWFARGFESSLPSYDQIVAAAAANADRLPWAVHIEDFRCTRMATLSLFQNMPPDAWMKTGNASDNSFSVRALAYLVAGHLAHHVTGLRERYLPTQPFTPSQS